MGHCFICGNTNPLCPHCGRSNPLHAEKSIPSMEQAPIVNQTSGQDGLLTNFKGSGHGHFSHIQPKVGSGSFHATTNIPGVGSNPVSLHDKIDWLK